MLTQKSFVRRASEFLIYRVRISILPEVPGFFPSAIGLTFIEGLPVERREFLVSSSCKQDEPLGLHLAELAASVGVTLRTAEGVSYPFIPDDHINWYRKSSRPFSWWEFEQIEATAPQMEVVPSNIEEAA